jgi:Trk K+ transport system NAD-binding subunit
MQLRNLDGTVFVDLTLQVGDKVIGQTVQAIADVLPNECLLISIRRNGRVFIPHGDTIFQPGDHITAFIQNRDTEALYNCLRGAQKTAVEAEQTSAQ